MRVTQHYGISVSQGQLDFVDVDATNDVKLFVDPQAFTILPSPWAHECVALIQDFFERIIEAIGGGRHAHAQAMLSALREPNDTHLGLSKGVSRGSGLGDELADKVMDSLTGSSAVASGLLKDLEDTALLVDGIGPDRISDITTNIIREQLLNFTIEACDYYGIPTEPAVSSGPIWNATTQTWHEQFVRRPIALGKPLLLVPKSIVRASPAYDPNEYYRNYILSYLEDRELRAGGSLVKLIRGNRRVSRKDLRAKYGVGKDVNLRWTREDPSLLEAYKEHKRRHPSRPLENETIAEATRSSPDDYAAMLTTVIETPPGPDHAQIYHKRVEGLLTALFYPLLVNPRREQELHSGRKRIDITYTNAAETGFFNWLSRHYPAPFIFVECKNYSRSVGNPEFDQLSGRFSPSRGKFGLLVYRGFDDKGRTLNSCRDTALDQRGFIIPLDDQDLKQLVSERLRQPIREYFGLLHERFQFLVS